VPFDTCLPPGIQIPFSLYPYTSFSLWAYSFTMKMEAECSSETSPNVYQSTRSHIPKDTNLQKGTNFQANYFPLLSSIYFVFDWSIEVGFEVPTAVAMKSSVFWDITPCGSVKFNWRFRGTCRLHLQGLRISQETSTKQAVMPVVFHRATLRYMAEDRTLQQFLFVRGKFALLSELRLLFSNAVSFETLQRRW
jgi:hypothetical protein